jgi:hypothetical protein
MGIPEGLPELVRIACQEIRKRAEEIDAVKQGNCACEVKNPSGKCCLGNVARVSQECIRAVRGT